MILASWAWWLKWCNYLCVVMEFYMSLARSRRQINLRMFSLSPVNSGQLMMCEYYSVCVCKAVIYSHCREVIHSVWHDVLAQYCVTVNIYCVFCTLFILNWSLKSRCSGRSICNSSGLFKLISLKLFSRDFTVAVWLFHCTQLLCCAKWCSGWSVILLGLQRALNLFVVDFIVIQKLINGCCQCLVHTVFALYDYQLVQFFNVGSLGFLLTTCQFMF